MYDTNKSEQKQIALETLAEWYLRKRKRMFRLMAQQKIAIWNAGAGALGSQKLAATVGKLAFNFDDEIVAIKLSPGELIERGTDINVVILVTPKAVISALADGMISDDVSLARLRLEDWWSLGKG